MIDLGDRTIYPDGTVVCKQSALMERLYAGKDLGGLLCDDQDDAEEWHNAARLCDSAEQGPEFAAGEIYSTVDWYQYWLTPEPYRSIDLGDWCLARCKTDVERERVVQELAEMQDRNMHPLIRHLIYCADVWRQNHVVWGVGRGSSVCSFVLYLTGINRINPLEYGLDIHEWLK